MNEQRFSELRSIASLITAMQDIAREFIAGNLFSERLLREKFETAAFHLQKERDSLRRESDDLRTVLRLQPCACYQDRECPKCSAPIALTSPFRTGEAGEVACS